MKEQSVEEYLVERVEAVGGFAPKTVWANRHGCPDREVYWPWGEIDKVELKRPVGGRYEPGQEQAHKRLAKLHVPVYLLHTREAVERYLAVRIRREHARSLMSVPDVVLQGPCTEPWRYQQALE